MPSKTHCYEIQDRKTCLTAIDTRKDFKSPCGWCFGEKCTGSQSLCEPKKWLLQRGLKLGQDYEDCLELGECPGTPEPIWHETIFCLYNFQILKLQAYVRQDCPAKPIAMIFKTEKPV